MAEGFWIGHAFVRVLQRHTTERRHVYVYQWLTLPWRLRIPMTCALLSASWSPRKVHGVTRSELTVHIPAQRKTMRRDVPTPSVRQGRGGEFPLPPHFVLVRLSPHWGGHSPFLNPLIEMRVSSSNPQTHSDTMFNRASQWPSEVDPEY